jgi:hypothetical protein
MFVWQYPLWTLISPVDPNALVEQIRVLHLTIDHDECVPVFTDDDLVERFGNNREESLQKCVIDSSATFINFLEKDSIPKTTHVVFDPPASGTLCKFIYPIEGILAALKGGR